MKNYICSHLENLDNLSVPSKTEDIAYKMELFLVRSRTKEALQFWEKVEESLGNSLDLQTVEDLHFRVSSMAYECTKHKVLKKILNSVPQQYQNNSYKILSHCLLRMEESFEYEGSAVFPFHILKEDRYDDGPHLFPLSHKGDVLSRWITGRIDDAEPLSNPQNMIMHTTILDIELQDVNENHLKVDEQRSQKAKLKLPCSILDDWVCTEEKESISPCKYFEIVEYGDQDKVPHIRFYPDHKMEDWNFYRDHMPPTGMDKNRYLRAEGGVPNGNSFVEKCVRGDERPSSVVKYIEVWDKGEVEFRKRGWPLSDYLGMTPDEYEQYQDDPESLPEIIENRKGF